MAFSSLLEDHLDRQLQRDAGMPHMYYALLVWLERVPDRRLRMTELASRAKITRSRLSHAVARLEGYGWLRRESSAADRRGQYAVLTDEGLRVLREAAPGHVAAVRSAIFARLTPEQQRAFGEICAALALGLETDGTEDLPWTR